MAIPTSTIASALRDMRTAGDEATDAATARMAATAARKTDNASEPLRPE